MADGVRIVKQDTETRFNDRNEPVETIRVQFMVDSDGPFFLRFPRDGYSGVSAKIAIDNFAREIRQARA